jgi:hypothetical protein
VRRLIVYYSRTGTTKTAAKALAGMMGADIAEITCDHYGRGLLRYFRAAYDSVRGKLPAIGLPALLRVPYDLVVIAAPIWASHPALPIRALLESDVKLPKRVSLLLTCMGSPPERAFAEMEARLPVPAEAKLALKSKDVQEDRVSAALRDFATCLSCRNGAYAATSTDGASR